jgi:hypothetical protein
MKNLTINWKTTLVGVIVFIIQVGPILLPNVITHELANTISAVAAALGLVVAKDGNVTGAGPTAVAK